MNTHMQFVPRAFTALLVACSTCLSQGQFMFENQNQGVEFVQYGRPFTFSVTWSNGAYFTNGNIGTWLKMFERPSGALTLEALYPVNGMFSYTIPSATSADEGNYRLFMDPTGTNGFYTSPVTLRVTPAILNQPISTNIATGQATTCGLVAGPSSCSFTWIDATTGSTLATTLSFTPAPALSGKWIYCRVSNGNGNIVSSPVQITIGSQLNSFAYANNNPGVTFVPFGGSFTYSVSWSNGSYNGGTYGSGTLVQSLNKPSGILSMSTVFPSTSHFTYTVPSVTSSDDGAYNLVLNGGFTIATTTPVYLRVTPAILSEPMSTNLSSGQATSFGLVAGPPNCSYAWIDAATGNTIASSLSFAPSTALNGKLIYCRVANNYGSVITQPVTVRFGMASPPFGYQNENPGVTIVPYGGAFTFSVSWSNAAYFKDTISGYGAQIGFLSRPSGTLSINTFFPATSSFSYSVPSAGSSDDGAYSLSINGGTTMITTPQVFLRVAPGIITQPVNMAVTNGATTTLGLVAGPSQAAFTWIDAVTGATLGTGASLRVTPQMDGKAVCCRISNTYGTITSSPAIVRVLQFNYTNGNQGVEIVRYGAPFTYSVSWSNGNYISGSTIGTHLNNLLRPGSSVPLNALFPTTGSFSYSIPSVSTTDEGSYSLSVNPGGSSFTTSPVYLRLAPGILTQPSDTFVASGTRTTMGMSAGPVSATYTWIDSSNGLVVANGSSFVATAAMNGKRLYCRIVNTYGTLLSSPALLSVSVLGPVITQQPSNQVTLLGQPVTFQVRADGAPPLSYAWFHNGQPVLNLNRDTHVIAATVEADAGTYTCVVSNSYGSVSSQAAELSFAEPPLITGHPQNATVKETQLVTLEGSASGSPLSYYWQKNGQTIPEATNASFTIPAADRDDAGVYTLVASNGLGLAVSTGAVLTVYYPPVIIQQPTAQNALAGQAASFSVGAGGGLLNYQWYKGDLTNGASADAFMTNGFVVGASVVSGGSGYVAPPRVRVLGGDGYWATAAAVLSNGVVVGVTILNPGAGYTSTPILVIDPPALLLEGKTNAVLNIAETEPAHAGPYHVVVSNPAGAVESEPATLTVNTAVYIVSQPEPQTVAAGSNANFSVTAAGDAPFTYQWFYAPPTAAFATALVSNGFVYAINLESGGAGYSNNPVVRITGGGGTGAMCAAIATEGVVTSINVLNPGSGYSGIPSVEIDPPTEVLLVNQTNPELMLQAVAPENAGHYFVLVSNDYGSVTSSFAPLVVTPGTEASNIVVNPPSLSVKMSGDGAQMALQFEGVAGHAYVLESATDLTPPVQWQPVCTNQANAQGLWQYTDSQVAGERRFYRVLAR